MLFRGRVYEIGYHRLWPDKVDRPACAVGGGFGFATLSVPKRFLNDLFRCVGFLGILPPFIY
jgi:hypothetical protein